MEDSVLSVDSSSESQKYFKDTSMQTIMEIFDILSPDNILDTLEILKQEYPTIWADNFFNNFVANLPGGYRWPGDWSAHDSDYLDAHIYKESKHCSDVKKQKTPRQFFADVETTIHELNFSNLSSDLLADINNNECVDNYLLPLYIALRKKWYNHYDLVW